MKTWWVMRQINGQPQPADTQNRKKLKIIWPFYTMIWPIQCIFHLPYLIGMVGTYCIINLLINLSAICNESQVIWQIRNDVNYSGIIVGMWWPKLTFFCVRCLSISAFLFRFYFSPLVTVSLNYWRRNMYALTWYIEIL